MAPRTGLANIHVWSSHLRPMVAAEGEDLRAPVPQQVYYCIMPTLIELLTEGEGTRNHRQKGLRKARKREKIKKMCES